MNGGDLFGRGAPGLHGLDHGVIDGEGKPDYVDNPENTPIDHEDTLPPMDDGKFVSEFKKWQEAVAAGVMEPADVLAAAASKYSLTEDQAAAIEAL